MSKIFMPTLVDKWFESFKKILKSKINLRYYENFPTHNKSMPFHFQQWLSQAEIQITDGIESSLVILTIKYIN